jgi:hypothetical protein
LANANPIRHPGQQEFAKMVQCPEFVQDCEVKGWQMGQSLKGIQ